MSKVGATPRLGSSHPWSRVGGPDQEKDTAHKILAARRGKIAEFFDDHWWIDNHCQNGELVRAALAYLVCPGDEVWPFDQALFNPGLPEDNMVVAGAFLAAEGDRLIRARLEGRPATSGLIVLGLDPEDVDRCVDGLRSIKDEIREMVKDFPTTT